MSAQPSVSRRDFLKISTLAGAGLLIGFHLPEGVAGLADVPQQAIVFEPNAFLRIDTDGNVTILVAKSEMGQGVQTSLPMLLAEELEVEWSNIRVEQAPTGAKYGDQFTGGSSSVSNAYAALRVAGYTARMMLIDAAAQQWGVDATTCYAENGVVIHTPTDQRLTYGELVEAAAALPAPKMQRATLKQPGEFRIIGTRQGQINNPKIVTGAPLYASDVRLPNMLYAVVARCPVFGGSITGFDASAAENVPGVRQVVEIDSGIAVVGENTWAAMKGRDALNLTWDAGDNGALDSESIRQMALVETEELMTDNVDRVAEAATVLEALYELPYLAHVTMEPMVCVADVRADGCDVWAPTQDPMGTQYAASAKAGVRPVNVHVTLLGGGFGRRLDMDFVEEAVEVSKLVGAPIKLIWTRTDDIQHGWYRPASWHQMRAGLDADNLPISWEHYVVGQPAHGAYPDSHGMGFPYQISAKSQGRSLNLPVPTGFWRAVFHQNAFASESFLDEIAVAVNRDPLEFRLSLLRENNPLRAVLELAAEKAGWGSPLPDGWGRGIACHSVWNATPVAQVAEVSVDDSGRIQVHRVVCAVDCGIAVNPDGVEAQIEGGIVMALSSLFHEEITFQEGRVQQSNFHDYPLFYLGEMPAIEVHILPSTDSPTGIGEMSNPVAVPAIANAIFAATGQPVRRLPIRM